MTRLCFRCPTGECACTCVLEMMVSNPTCHCVCIIGEEE